MSVFRRLVLVFSMCIICVASFGMGCVGGRDCALKEAESLGLGWWSEGVVPEWHWNTCTPFSFEQLEKIRRDG